PAGFASSLKRLGWNYDFNNLLSQPLFMRDHLEADRAAMEAMDKNDIVSQAALLWKFIYRFVHGTRDSFPQFNILRHEDLSRNPVTGFQALYKSLGLEFTERARYAIENSSSSENPAKLARNKTHSVKLDSRASLDNWKKILSPEEISRIRRITEGVSESFYSESEW
ncbi:MAG: sulfotransferase domain-containing protein, partial [Anaerolineales bacterium]|nr:sulfotransferase domain-containing protein [Anaerolineales bacterium]